MDGRLLPCGERAVLIEVDDLDGVAALRSAVDRRRADEPFADVTDVVPAARTLLLVVADARSLPGLRRAADELLAGTSPSASPAEVPDPVVIDVCYDGPDLDEVARLCGLSSAEVVDAHTGSDWTVAFGGFAPGFAYLAGGDPRLRVPRRAEPRTRVPAGAVGLAGQFSGVYPRASPGGWQLIGRTAAPLWNPDRQPPALLMPGAAVRFHAVAAVDDPPGIPSPSWHAGSGPALVVESPGALSIAVDEGRPGYAALGLSPSGAADRSAYRLGARLLGDSPGLPAVEVLMGGLTVRAEAACVVALTGADAAASVDGRRVAHAAPVYLRAGQRLSLGIPASGLRTYLTVRRGFTAPDVLGSVSTDLLAGLGPPPLRAGDRLALAAPGTGAWPGVDLVPTDPTPRPLQMLPGPRLDWLEDPSALTRTTWRVTERSDRIGVRLDGAALRRHPARAGAELASEPMVRGSIQVPPDGRPVIMGADHPVTGGYPVVGVLSAESSDRLAQARPGDVVELVAVRLSRPAS